MATPARRNVTSHAAPSQWPEEPELSPWDHDVDLRLYASDPASLNALIAADAAELDFLRPLVIKQEACCSPPGMCLTLVRQHPVVPPRLPSRIHRGLAGLESDTVVPN